MGGFVDSNVSCCLHFSLSSFCFVELLVELALEICYMLGSHCVLRSKIVWVELLFINTLLLLPYDRISNFCKKVVFISCCIAYKTSQWVLSLLV